jgi:hypothetical protein
MEPSGDTGIKWARWMGWMLSLIAHLLRWARTRPPHPPRPYHRIDAILPTADYPAKYHKACPAYDDDSDGRPEWWTSMSDESKMHWLDFSLWEYFFLPRALWKTQE